MRARHASGVLVLWSVCLLGGACAKGTSIGTGGEGGASSTSASSGSGSGGATTGSSATGGGGGATSTSQSATSSTTSGTTVKCDPLTCGGCPCTSDECIMCCAYKNKVNACSAGNCYCF